MYQEMLGLRFERVEAVTGTTSQAPAVWHPDVYLYRVYEARTHTATETHSDTRAHTPSPPSLKAGDFVGHFYLDLHPREGKYSHACAYVNPPSRVHALNARCLLIPTLPLLTPVI